MRTRRPMLPLGFRATDGCNMRGSGPSCVVVPRLRISTAGGWFQKLERELAAYFGRPDIRTSGSSTFELGVNALLSFV